ncbi:hypothetical protein [Microcoleus sp. B9-D4]|uniref:hypothetical protein n=1 Tax=Microcoleus sp. B9-D4 TaxID=2818711 RepID=UPI002FD765D0
MNFFAGRMPVRPMASENRFLGAASNLKCNYFPCTGAGAFEQTFNSTAYAPQL